VANFTSNTTSGNAPKTIQFWDNSTNTPTSWQWSWGDLTANGTTETPTHTYTIAGTYTVTLTATNSDGSGTFQRTNYISIASGVIPFPGEINTPTNPLGGTLYWDTNGNGRIDYNDLVIFFNNLAWAQTNEPTWAFDFNSNGRLDYNDVQLLFGRL
jgi:PKD repeat protein